MKWLSVVLLVVLLLVVALASSILWTSYGTRMAIEEAVGVVNDIIPGEVAVGGVEGALADGLVLHDVVIADPEGGEALRLERLELRVELWDLVSKRVWVDSLTLSGLELSLFDNRRRMGLLRAFVVESVAPDDPSEPSDWVVDVAHLQLERVTVVTHVGGPTLVRDLAVAGEFHYDRESIRWKGLSISGELVDPLTPNVPRGDFGITSDGALEGDRLRVDRFTAAAGGTRLDLSAELPSLTGRAGRLTLTELSTDLESLSRLLGLPPLLGAGRVSGELESDGSWVSARLSILAGDSPITIDARMAIGPLLMTGTPGPWTLKLAGERIRPAAILPGLPPLSLDALDLRASGEGMPLAGGLADLSVAARGLQMAGIPIRDADIWASLVGPSADLRFEARGDAMGVVRGAVRMPHVAGTSLDVSVSVAGLDVAPLLTSLGLSALKGTQGQVPELALDAHAELMPGGPPSVAANLALRLEGLALPETMGPARASALAIDAALAYSGRGLPTGRATVVLEEAGASAFSGGHTTLSVEAVAAGDELRVTAQGDVRGLLGPSGLSVAESVFEADATLSPGGRLSAASAHLSVESVSQGPWFVTGVALETALIEQPEGAVFTGPLLVRGAIGPDGMSVGTVSGQLSASLGQRLSGVAAAADGAPLGARADLAVDDLELGSGRGIRHASAKLDAHYGAKGLDGQLVLGATAIDLAGVLLDDVSLLARLSPGERGQLELRARQGALRAGVDVGVAFQDGFAGAITLSLSKLFARRGPVGLESLGVAQVSYDPAGRVGLGGLRLQLDGGGAGREPAGTSLALDATFDLKTQNLTLEVAMPRQRLERWLTVARGVMGAGVALPDIGGEIAVTADLRGTPARLLGDLDVHLSNASVGRTRGIGADLDLTLSGADARATLSAAWGDVHVDAELVSPWPIRDGGKTKLTLSTSELDLALLGELVPTAPPLTGAARFEARLAGAWPHIEGTASVRGRRLAVAPLNPLDVTLNVALASGRLRADVVAGDGKELEARVELPVDLGSLATASGRSALMATPLTGHLALTGAPLRRWMTGLARPIGKLRVGAGLDFLGPVGAVAITGDVQATGGLLKKRHARVAFTSDGQQGRVRATLHAAERELARVVLSLPEALGAAAMRPDPMSLLREPAVTLDIGPLDLDFEGLEALSPGLGQVLAGLVGPPTLRGSFRFHGDPGGPVGSGSIDLGSTPASTVASTAESDAPSLELRPPLINAASLEVVVEQGRVTTRLLASRPGAKRAGGALDVVVEAGLGSGGVLSSGLPELTAIPLGGHVRVKALAVDGLAALMPAVLGPSDGDIDVDLALAGTFGQPRLVGRTGARLTRLVVGPLGLDQPDVDLGIRFDGDAIELGPLRLVQPEGSLELELGATFPTFQARDVRLRGAITLDHYRVLGRDDLTATLSGTIGLSGTLVKPGVLAKLRLDEIVAKPSTGGRDVVPIGKPDGVVYLNDRVRPTGLDSASIASSILHGLDLDLAIEIPHRSVRVKNDMVDLQASGDLRITSRGAQLAVVGQVGVDEGRVFVYGREFAISPDSKVYFDGSNRLEPTLDVRATFDISGVDLTPVGPDLVGKEITLAVTGVASRPRVRLTSDPEMSQTFIMSIITLGFPAGGGQSGKEDKGRIANLVMGLVSASASRMLQDKLPVDVFKVETGGSQLSKTRITVGRRILRNLMVAYHADLGAREGENTNEVRLQYELTQRLHLDGRYGDGKAGAMDLFYRWRF
ncbi:MAG: translocation/assembly module TamB domain-containing protein [Myxococcales bacterium]|nr:translocation/assembly module TamB domain-containing protein [Myxococcales bacterium]